MAEAIRVAEAPGPRRRTDPAKPANRQDRTAATTRPHPSAERTNTTQTQAPEVRGLRCYGPNHG
jgi:hypothetical protein